MVCVYVFVCLLVRLSSSECLYISLCAFVIVYMCIQLSVCRFYERHDSKGRGMRWRKEMEGW